MQCYAALLCILEKKSSPRFPFLQLSLQAIRGLGFRVAARQPAKPRATAAGATRQVGGSSERTRDPRQARRSRRRRSRLPPPPKEEGEDGDGEEGVPSGPWRRHQPGRALRPRARARRRRRGGARRRRRRRVAQSRWASGGPGLGLRIPIPYGP